MQQITVQHNTDDSRATHFIADYGNIGLKRPREHNCPNPTALAKQTKIGLDLDNCHSFYFLKSDERFAVLIGAVRTR